MNKVFYEQNDIQGYHNFETVIIMQSDYWILISEVLKNDRL